MKIYVTGAMLKAALIHAAKQDMRLCLNGVLIEATPEETRVVGADGPRCCVVRVETENEGVDRPVQFIIPREVVESMKISPSLLGERISLEDTPGGMWKASGIFFDLTFKPLADTYPDYRRTIPDETSGEVAQYDPAYLLDALKAAKLLAIPPKLYNTKPPRRSKTAIHVQHNGTGPCVVTTDNPDFW